jgi:pyruvate dehydrogenase E1 component
VIWGDDWDPLLERTETGLLVKRMNEVVDGEYQKYTVEPAPTSASTSSASTPSCSSWSSTSPTSSSSKLRRGGHDPEKVYAAYKAAPSTTGAPTVILAKTIKGYGLGEAGEGRNVTHQQKKLNEEELREFRDRFGIPISDEDVAEAPFYRPPEDSPRSATCSERREALGGYVPAARKRAARAAPSAGRRLFAEFLGGRRPRGLDHHGLRAHARKLLMSDKRSAS